MDPAGRHILMKRIIYVWLLIGAGVLYITFGGGCQTRPSSVGSLAPKLTESAVAPGEDPGEIPYPSAKPNAARGKIVFDQNCATCHSLTSPVDFTNRLWRREKMPGLLYALITDGGAHHPAFRDKLTKDQRWDSIFYAISVSLPIQNLEANKLLFGQNCLVCHGKTGFGNGPLSNGLVPNPQRFADRKITSQFTDAYMYFRISEGGKFKEVPAAVLKFMPNALEHANRWSAMPAWKEIFTEEERWRLIDYIRTFEFDYE